MKGKDQHIDYDALIAKRLSGEISAEENLLLEDWLQVEENLQYYQSLENIWANTETEVWLPDNTAVDAAWEKVKSARTSTEKSSGIRYLAIAASLALVFSLVYYLTKDATPTANLLVAQTEGVGDTVFLADGSTVFMEPYSLLSYPEEFETNQRNVQLVDGKATFEVKGNKYWPFTIEAGHGMVRVVGTRFTVAKAIDSVHVAVAEGVVEFFKVDENEEKPGEVVQLKKGEQSYITEEVEVPKVTPIALEEALSFHSFQFDSSPLIEVVKEWEEKYNVTIQLTGELHECLLTAKITEEDIDGVLDILSTVYPVEIEKDENLIKISGEGC